MARMSAAFTAAGFIALFIGPIATASAHGLDQPKAYQEASIDRSMVTGSIEPDADEAEKDGQSAISGPYAALITKYANENHVSPELADAVVRIESNYDPKAHGSAGEIGLMQVKPSTARMLGYTGSIKALYKPSINIKYGMRYLAAAQQLGDGTTCGTILKYNAGHGATHMNPISKRYCTKVIAYIDSLS